MTLTSWHSVHNGSNQLHQKLISLTCCFQCARLLVNGFVIAAEAVRVVWLRNKNDFELFSVFALKIEKKSIRMEWALLRGVLFWFFFSLQTLCCLIDDVFCNVIYLCFSHGFSAVLLHTRFDHLYVHNPHIELKLHFLSQYFLKYFQIWNDPEEWGKIQATHL